MEDEYFDENEEFADLLAAASYQDSVTKVAGQEQRELHRNVWEFWQVMRQGQPADSAENRTPRKAKQRAKNQTPKELSYGQKKARTAWRIFYFDAAMFVISCILGWTILMFICGSAVSLIFSWSILPKRENLRRLKISDYLIHFILNAFWIGLMAWLFFGNALDSASTESYTRAHEGEIICRTPTIARMKIRQQPTSGNCEVGNLTIAEARQLQDCKSVNSRRSTIARL